MYNNIRKYIIIIIPLLQPKPNYGRKYKTEKDLHSAASKGAKLWPCRAREPPALPEASLDRNSLQNSLWLHHTYLCFKELLLTARVLLPSEWRFVRARIGGFFYLPGALVWPNFVSEKFALVNRDFELYLTLFIRPCSLWRSSFLTLGFPTGRDFA